MALVERGLAVTAPEPAPAMAAAARLKLGGRAEVHGGRFEDWAPAGGAPPEARDRATGRIIDEEFGGSVTKVEDAVLSLARRR